MFLASMSAAICSAAASKDAAAGRTERGRARGLRFEPINDAEELASMMTSTASCGLCWNVSMRRGVSIQTKRTGKEVPHELLFAYRKRKIRERSGCARIFREPERCPHEIGAVVRFGETACRAHGNFVHVSPVAADVGCAGGPPGRLRCLETLLLFVMWDYKLKGQLQHSTVIDRQPLEPRRVELPLFGGRDRLAI